MADRISSVELDVDNYIRVTLGCSLSFHVTNPECKPVIHRGMWAALRFHVVSRRPEYY